MAKIIITILVEVQNPEKRRLKYLEISMRKLVKINI